MDIKTMHMPTVTVVKDAHLWGYTDHKNRWTLVSKSMEAVTIRHGEKGEAFTIDNPDRVLMLATTETGWSEVLDITNQEVIL